VASQTEVFGSGAHGTLSLYWATGRGSWHRTSI
jgi:hypothetical protein